MPEFFTENCLTVVPPKSRAYDLDVLMRGYTLCAATEGKSSRTVIIMGTAIRVFKTFLENNNRSIDVHNISPLEIRAFILYLQQVQCFTNHKFTGPQTKHLSGHTINTYMRSLRAFWSWMMREEIITVNPFTKVRIPKAPEVIIATYSTEQLDKLLKCIDTLTRSGFRDWTIILLLLDTGMRVSELTGLKLEVIDLEAGMLKVTGKGKKQRTVPFGTRVQKALWKYIQRYRHQPCNSLCTYLLLNQNGDPYNVDRVRNMIYWRAKNAGIHGVRSSPHTFRHTFAISYLRNGGDVFSLQKILGHSSLEIVRMYVNLAEVDIKAAHRRFSPADNLQIR